MKIIIIGATGTIGKHVVKALEPGNEIIKAGSKSGDLQVNISDNGSIKNLFEKVGSFDALISTTGDAHFGPLREMSDANFRAGLNSKLMGQINLVLIGQHYINPKGSFTLTSGSLGEDPVVFGASVSAINGALDAFVKAAAIELENGVRINAVSPDVVEESPDYFPYFPGHIPVSMNRVAQAYVKSVLGAQTGQTYKVL
ncbi:short chain dehydrogenase [Mucilaginibacter gossypii]|uniref:NAD(P)-dependent dehydrogenase, short-chain alcohol dehydrogenase family n=1 Tax=Mucilaginibacter gossypii TaxID=551996 RepID=A0A1G8AIL0_9SPHI|nr:short chain dehydrogenase [Mucilaginibacter gossypii]SDH20673.1 NAD(P)-dependent dehydrogenase, short-chain alcohol dehydrogenase family [Mucilaginibacter gossypii]